METLSQILTRNSRLLADRAFIISDGDTLTYRQFADRTAQLANILRDKGVAKGDRVGLYLPSTTLMAIAFWACQRLGAIPAPVSAMFRHAELRHIVPKASFRAFIADAATWPYFAEIHEEFAELDITLVATGTGGPDDLLAQMATAPSEFEDEACEPTDIACLFFTSGTTGKPKGTAQPHAAIVSTLRDMMVSHRNRFGEEVYICAVPLFTNFGLNVTVNLCLYCGGAIVLHERWNTERVLTDIAKYGATYFGGTPTMYVYMVDEIDPERHDLSSLRICTTGGSPVPQPVIKRFEQLSGARVTQVYGSTETCGQNVMEPTMGVRKPGAAGLPVGSSRIKVVNEGGGEVPFGTVGEVIIGGDCVAAGYWQDPEATKAAFGPDGWRSGDLGYVDEDGYLFIVDRKKDVIIAGGHNIYPLEIEAVLYSHPEVTICAVVGLPDASKGEVPIAVIVRDKGSALSDETLNAHCREHLAAYKVPRRFEFVDDMPIEAAKIRKRDLVEALQTGRMDKYRR